MEIEDYTGVKIIFFDGICNLCNSFVDFSIRHNKGKNIYYCSLQSDFARAFLRKYGIDPLNAGSIIFYDSDEVYMRSSAVLKAARYYNGLYPVLSRVFIFFPVMIRDAIYKMIARNRYKWWGKRNICRLPTKDEKELLIA